MLLLLGAFGSLCPATSFGSDGLDDFLLLALGAFGRAGADDFLLLALGRDGVDDLLFDFLLSVGSLVPASCFGTVGTDGFARVRCTVGITRKLVSKAAVAASFAAASYSVRSGPAGGVRSTLFFVPLASTTTLGLCWGSSGMLVLGAESVEIGSFNSGGFIVTTIGGFDDDFDEFILGSDGMLGDELLLIDPPDEGKLGAAGAPPAGIATGGAGGGGNAPITGRDGGTGGAPGSNPPA